MNIVIVAAHAPDSPDIDVFKTMLDDAGVSYEISNERLPGSVSFIPCVAAVNDAGVVVESGGKELSGQTLKAWRDTDGSVEPVIDDAQPSQPTLMEIKAKLAEITALVNAL